MNIKSNEAMAQDPTFETKGPMRIILSNQTDRGGTLGFPLLMGNPLPNYPFSGLAPNVSQATLTYGPSGNPPPPWVLGKDWKLFASGLAVPPLQFPVVYNQYGGNPAWPIGNAEVLLVADRSAAKVALNGQYIFDLPFTTGGSLLSIHFTLNGLAGGSTVLPGFGLFNLGSNPGAWTYVTPIAFDGIWSIQLRSDDFFNYATLSLCYVRYSNTGRFGWTSRLVYSVSGITMCPQSLSITKAEIPEHDTQADKPIVSALDIFRASGDYKTVRSSNKEM
jgi:hypothetical protein